jgi:hypothetical protein
MRGPSTLRGRILLRFLFYGAAVFLGLPLAFSQSLVGTHRQPTSPPPSGFEEIALTSDGLRLRSWVTRGDAARPAVVVAHGLGADLEDELEAASALRQRGHTVLLTDFRGHGGSEGEHTTLGGREREDVRAGITYLESQRLAASGVVLFGCSMGAVAALRAAVDRNDVRAIIAEAPFDTYRETVAHHAQLIYGLPRWVPLIPLAIAVAEWRAAFDADDVDAVDAARRVGAPLLAIVDGADPRMPEAVVRRLYDAHRGAKRLWLAPQAPHCGARLRDDYWPQVFGFLEENGA